MNDEEPDRWLALTINDESVGKDGHFLPMVSSAAELAHLLTDESENENAAHCAVMAWLMGRTSTLEQFTLSLHCLSPRSNDPNNIRHWVRIAWVRIASTEVTADSIEEEIHGIEGYLLELAEEAAGKLWPAVQAPAAVRFHNFYRCDDCEIAWEDPDCDSTHEDECPDCGKPHTPVSHLTFPAEDESKPAFPAWLTTEIAPEPSDEIERMLVLSTSHIKRTTATLLRRDHALADARYSGGFSGHMAYAEGHLLSTSWQPRMLDEDVPSELQHLLDYAKSIGCSYLRLDSDGPVSPRFPTFDW